MLVEVAFNLIITQCLPGRTPECEITKKTYPTEKECNAAKMQFGAGLESIQPQGKWLVKCRSTLPK